jgi:hypothetical protein
VPGRITPVRVVTLMVSLPCFTVTLVMLGFGSLKDLVSASATEAAPATLSAAPRTTAAVRMAIFCTLGLPRVDTSRRRHTKRGAGPA